MKRKFMNNRKYVTLTLVLAIPLVLYAYRFISNSFSSDPNDWIVFMDYLVNLGSLYALIFFSYIVYQYNQQIDRPELVFRTYTDTGENKWKIENVGKGNAINLVIGYKKYSKAQWEVNIATDYILAQGNNIIVDWDVMKPYLLCAVYEDIHGAKYVSLIKDYKCKVYPFKNSSFFLISDTRITAKEIELLEKMENNSIEYKRIVEGSTTNSSTTTTITTSNNFPT